MDDMTLKEAALYYARMGFAVFPLIPKNKYPATKNGFKAATTDLVQIGVWWDRHPDSNIGIATGSASGGLVVIDIDIDKDKGIEGNESFKKWQREHGELPDTVRSITGRRGYHYLYRDSAQWGNRTGLYEGVDVRGEGGYIVAPPSVHPNGNRYEWEQPPDEYAIAPADSMVRAFLMPEQEKQNRRGFHAPDAIPEGGRTDTLVRLVCSQQAKGLSDEAIRAAVRAENEAKCVPPLSDAELEKEVFPALKRYQKGTSSYRQKRSRSEAREKGHTAESDICNLKAVIRSIQNGYPVYIVQGQKNVDTLKQLGYAAAGVKVWKKEDAAYFTGARVVILPTNDEAGLELKDQMIRSLKHFAHSIRWTLTSEENGGDVSGYMEDHTGEDLARLVSESENRGAPWLYVEGKGENARTKINADILADSISRGLPYLIVRRPEEDKDDFYIYEDGVYEKCNRNKVKAVIRRYVPVGLASDNMINNVYNLLLCKENNIRTYRDLDTDETYINVRNGLYNLKTGRLERHTPEVYSTLQLNCEYHPEDVSRPVFDRYINDLCRDHDGVVDEEKKAVIQEYMGLILSNVGVYRLKMCIVLWSALGNSGKTQILNLVGELLGNDRIANIPLQNMNEESKFAMGSILGKRLISIGDQTGSDIKDSATFKQLTGGDPVKVEPKNKQPFYYRFNGGIAIACNNLPSFQDDKGGHVFERLCIVPCLNTIERDRRDGALLDKMLLERNAIFNWFLEGLHRLTDHNFKLTRSRACEEAVNEYRDRMDTVHRYLAEHYTITGNKADMMLKKDFDNAYVVWCQMNEFTHVSRQNIKDRMEANGCPAVKARYGQQVGVMVYRNLKVKNVTRDFEPVSQEEFEQMDFPFKGPAEKGVAKAE